MGMAFGVGFICGPALGGVLGHIEPRLPFWAAAALAFVNGLYGLFVLPESLPRERRAPFRLANANPLGSLRLLRSHPQLPAIAAALFLYFLAFQALTSTFVLYSQFRYGWTTLAVGAFLAAVGLSNIPVQVFMIRPFVGRFGERGALYTGLLCGAVGFAIYAAAPNGWLFLCGVPVFALTGLIQPGAQGLMTRRVGADAQGRLQGANSALMALAGLIGPVLFTQVFAWSIHVGRGALLPGLALYMAAALILAAFLLATRVPRLAEGET
jgi:DHA1 family tetracycline resistance protein-like MFS transporter